MYTISKTFSLKVCSKTSCNCENILVNTFPGKIQKSLLCAWKHILYILLKLDYITNTIWFKLKKKNCFQCGDL